MSTFAPADRRLQPRFDVCIVGGGPAGAAAALAARSRGATVGLIAPPPQRATGSLELLAGRARRPLATLGLLDLVSSVAEPCVGTVNRWAGTGFDEQSCLLDPDGAGWIADRGRLDAALRATAAESGVTVVAERALHIDAQTSGELARVHLRHHDIRADAVIGARLEPGVITGLGVRLLIDRSANGWWYALADTAQTDIVYCTDAVELAGGGRADAPVHFAGERHTLLQLREHHVLGFHRIHLGPGGSAVLAIHVLGRGTPSCLAIRQRRTGQS